MTTHGIKDRMQGGVGVIRGRGSLTAHERHLPALPNTHLQITIELSVRRPYPHVLFGLNEELVFNESGNEPN